jgi:uncharacterized membrane protein
VKNKTYAALVAATTAWSLAIIVAPAFGVLWIYDVFSHICHQDSARSWHLAAAPFAVCIRCASIYFAFTVSLWIGVKMNVRWLRLSIVLMVCEFILARLVLDDAMLRSISGLLVGLFAAPFVKQALEEIRDAM